MYTVQATLSTVDNKGGERKKLGRGQENISSIPANLVPKNRREMKQLHTALKYLGLVVKAQEDDFSLHIPRFLDKGRLFADLLT